MAEIGNVNTQGPSGRMGYTVSNNVRVVAPNATDKKVLVRSGAIQAAEQNANISHGRLMPSSPVAGADAGKKYPGTKSPSTPTNISNINNATPKDEARAMKAAQAKPKGTQAGHAVTTSDNHTRPIKSSKGGAVTGALGEIGGGGMNWETK